MSDSARSLLVRGIASAKARDAAEARFFLEWVLRTESTPEQRADAYFWLSEISEDPDEKRALLEETIAFQPTHYRARRSLAVLDGRLDPEDIIDPDKPPPPQDDLITEASAQRFVCPQCGGRLTYTADGESLTCEYCARKRTLAGLDQGTGSHIAGQDFLIALATARGHKHPVTVRTFECHGCGAVFLLTPKTVSMTCPYCASVYVVEQAETRELLPPDGIIPFSIDEPRARVSLIAWYKKQRLPTNIRMAPPQGLYFPAWIFAISGPLPWKCTVPDDNEWDSTQSNSGWEPLSGLELVAQKDILVPASHTVSEKWVSGLDEYNFEKMTLYDPAFLADWTAESYQISLSDASLKARSKVLKGAHTAVVNKIPGFHKDLHLDSKDLIVEYFNLIMLPLWITHYRIDRKRYAIIVNGQTGKVWGSKPGRGVIKWLTSLFKDE